jgi:hypothetical protein
VPDAGFELKMSVRSQARWEFRNREADDESVAAFQIPRLRFQLEGFAFGEANAFKVEFDMANRGFSLLKDFFIDRDFSGIHLRVGQWKRPFSRHEIVSDFAGQFLERSIANAFGGGSRDIGFAVHNNYEKSPEGIEWAVGMFNGFSDRASQSLDCDDPMDATTCTPTTPTNVPSDYDPTLVARLGFNHGGIKGYNEGDVEGGPLRFAAGASYKLDLNNFAKDAEGDVVLAHAAEVDAILKIQGFSVTGALYLVKVGDADAELGFFGQAGYMVVPKMFELAGRFAQIPDAAVDDEEVQEALAAVTWFFSGHNFKWMTDGGVINSTAGSETDVQIRTQLQAVF